MLNIERYYTKSLVNGPKEVTSIEDVFGMFKWKNVDIDIKNWKTGESLFKAEGLEFPEDYSQQACEIIAKMYFRKAGVPETEHETSMKDVAARMVNFWVLSMIDEKLIDIDQMIIVRDELLYMILNQMWAPNSPQWFNTGLKHAYGIEGQPCGHYYYDEYLGKTVLSKDSYTRTQGSACFIVNIEDTMIGEQGLMDNLETASRLFKYGSGVGSNWSKIRAKGEKLSGGGASSGLLSFQKVYDENAGAIKSGGVTRRAAVMEILDLDHPDILEFINWKSEEEKKVRDLGKMGYDTSIAGEAYNSVSGQNVNNSVSIPDDFMKAVEAGKFNDDWQVKGRIDHSVDHSIKVGEIWDAIGDSAWECGDPGVQFKDIINRWNTCANSGPIRGSNPCSEFLFLDDNSCNLASINIMKYYDIDKNKFDLKGYLHSIDLIQMVLESTVNWGQFPTKQIAENTWKFRPTGLGLTNIGSLIMALALPYDSVEARSICAALAGFMTGESYLMSANMAESIGPFNEFEKNKEPMMNVINAHRNAWATKFEIDGEVIYDFNKVGALFTSIDIGVGSAIWDECKVKGDKTGFRNAQVTVMAPTGTIAFAMDSASTSSEPFFAHVVYKKLVDGSYMKICNPMIETALKKLKYSNAAIKSICDHVTNGDGNIESAEKIKKKDLPVFDTANKCGSGQRYLEPGAHVRMVAAFTPFISGSLSKTCNVPHEATVDDIKQIYLYAWKLGCKCIALYRDGCKVCQPLNTAISDENAEKDLNDMTYEELIQKCKELQKKLDNAEVRNTIEWNVTDDKSRQANQVDEFTRNPEIIKPVNNNEEDTNVLEVIDVLEDPELSDYTRAKFEKENVNTEDDYVAVKTPIRERLPYEPKCIKNAVKMGGYTFHITRSFYDDGRLGEIFATVGKQGDTVKGLMEVLCILMSKALQYGIPASVISDILRGSEFGPNGMVRNHPYIKSAASIPDLISKFIDISYGDYTHCQVKPDNEKQETKEVKMILHEFNTPNKNGRIYAGSSVKNAIVNEHMKNVSTEGSSQYVHGKKCSECGSTHIVQAGTCFYCTECGTSSGCS